MPAVHGATLSAAAPALNTTPGVAVTRTITVTNVGNVPESITLSPDATAGLAVSGLSLVSLQPGESKSLAITLTPDAATPLNTRLDLTLTAVFSGAVVELPPTLFLEVHVAVPGATAIADAAVAAGQLGNAALANRLDDLSIALTSLVQDPTSDVFKSQALASLDSILSLLAADPVLSTFVADLTAGRGRAGRGHDARRHPGRGDRPRRGARRLRRRRRRP